MTRLHILAFAVCGPLLPHRPLGAQLTAPARDSARAELRAFLRESKAPSVSVAVAIGGRIVFADAAGWADRERRIRATAATMYSIASVTKPITATAVMRLVERGALALDAPVNRYLGAAHLRSWGADADGATVRRVLSHTAGLPEHLDYRYADEPPGAAPIDTSIARYGIVVFEPGALYQYANLGYGVLASIVARRTGLAFPDAVRREVFAPLGMRQSRIRARQAPPGVASRHDATGAPLPDFHLLDVDGASAGYASASDLARFGAFHLGHRGAGRRAILADSTRALMQHRATPAHGAGYGLGWELAVVRGERAVLHSGGMPGVRARLALFPDRDAVVVVLVNGEDWPAALYGRLLSMVGLPPEPANVAPASPPPARELLASPFAGEWRGNVRTYDGMIPFAFTVRADGSALAALGDAPMTAVDDVTFTDGFVYGFVAGVLPTADARRRPGRAWVQVRREGASELRGAVYQGSEAGPRDRYTLASEVRLTRVR